MQVTWTAWQHMRSCACTLTPRMTGRPWCRPGPHHSLHPRSVLRLRGAITGCILRPNILRCWPEAHRVGNCRPVSAASCGPQWTVHPLHIASTWSLGRVALATFCAADKALTPAEAAPDHAGCRAAAKAHQESSHGLGACTEPDADAASRPALRRLSAPQPSQQVKTYVCPRQPFMFPDKAHSKVFCALLR